MSEMRQTASRGCPQVTAAYRAEQLERWEKSETNSQPAEPKRPSKIRFNIGTVFLAACDQFDRECVIELLEQGADINTVNIDGLTALHQACINNNLEVVEFLVSRGANINLGDNEGWTPLHAAASCGLINVARFLIESGADLSAVNNDCELPVDIAEDSDVEEMLRQYMNDRNIDADAARNVEVNRLMAFIKENTDNINEKYRTSLDPKTGGTCLHIAAAKGYIEVMQCLLEEHEVQPDVFDKEGWTPLHAAAHFGQQYAAAMLLRLGADPELRTIGGLTCVNLADDSISKWLQDIVTSTLAHRVKLETKSEIAPVLPDAKEVTNEINDIIKNEAADKDKRRPPSALSSSNTPKPVVPTPSSPAGNIWRSSLDATPTIPTIIPTPPAISPKENEVNEVTANSTPPSSVKVVSPVEKPSKPVSIDADTYPNNQSPKLEVPSSPVPQSPSNNESAAQTPSPIQTSPTSGPPSASWRNSLTKSGETIPQVDVLVRRPPVADKTAVLDQISSPTNSPTRVRSSASSQDLNNSPTTTPTRLRSATEDLQNNTGPTPPTSTPPKLTPGNIFKNFFKSFVPPVRDDESETQRKAHAKRVRETRRSTQGVNLDEVKSAEEFVKKKASNGISNSENTSALRERKKDTSTANHAGARGGWKGDVAVTVALASATATATATIAASSAERRPSWRLRLDPTNKFELEEDDIAAANATEETTYSIPLRRSRNNAVTANATTTPRASVITNATVNAAAKKEEKGTDERAREVPSTSSSTQAALNVIQRRRRPKRRSTGVGHVDMDDILNDRSGSGEGDMDTDEVVSGSESKSDAGTDERDYKALYEAAKLEVLQLREMLCVSEQHLLEARAMVSRLTAQNPHSMSEVEKREKRAMERKLSEMEEELKQLQKLKAENERLRAENRALTRVVSKLTNSAGK